MLRSIRASAADALATADLRRLQTAWATSAVGSWVFFVALSVYAYDVGGATAVGAAAFVRMVPAGLAAPLAGMLVDRHPRRDVLAVSLALRGLLLALLFATTVLDAPIAVVLSLAALFTIVSTAHKPAQASLLPTLAQTPHQLAASNAVWSGVDNAAFLFGSLGGGVLIATGGPESAFAATAVLYGLAAIPVLRIPRDPVPDYRADHLGEHPLREASQGFREVAADRGLRLVVSVLAIATLVEGIVDVLVVVVALDLLSLADAGVGWLNACWGAGGMLGGAAALVLLGRGRLAAGLAGGGLLVGVSMMGLAAADLAVVAGALLVVLGVGYALIETAGLSLLQRLSADDVLGRAFAVVESSYWVATGVGAMIAPALVSLLGARESLLVVGAFLALVVAARWVALGRLEVAAPVPEGPFRALRSVPAFAPLPICRIEDLARRVKPLEAGAGTVLMREGEPGDCVYVLAAGRVAIDVHGEFVAERYVGEFIGEIAILRQIPRTATVTCVTPSLLYELDREMFCCAISAHPRTSETVRATADSRFATVPTA
jgi:MFS family permease